MNKKKNSPILEALKRHIAREKISLHMPGHKGGDAFSRSFTKEFISFDVTELPGLDHFHNPKDVLLESMTACAEAFGAKRSFFLVNGSTSGIHAMLLSCFQRGDKILVDRNCHSSVIHGLILFGLQPVFVMPGFNEQWQVTIPAETAIWEKALKENVDVKGVLITSPDYFGLCAPISDLSDMIHESGKLLLVDEAHGAHFAFSRQLPDPALRQGADLCVQSLHKTLPAFTQAAVLHIGSSRIDPERVKKAVSMLTTTSPSYMMMASIDYARTYAEKRGSKKYKRLIQNLKFMRQQLTQMKRFRLIPDILDLIQRDPTRIVIDTSKSDLSGFELYRILIEKYGIVAEMADEYHVICIVTMTDSKQKINRLRRSLKELDHKAKDGNEKMDSYRRIPQGNGFIPDTSVFLRQNRQRLLKGAEGCISMGMVTPYPPGIPVLCPGERIAKEHIEYLYRIHDNGGDIHGLTKKDGELVITVV